MLFYFPPRNPFLTSSPNVMFFFTGPYNCKQIHHFIFLFSSESNLGLALTFLLLSFRLPFLIFAMNQPPRGYATLPPSPLLVFSLRGTARSLKPSFVLGLLPSQRKPSCPHTPPRIPSHNVSLHLNYIASPDPLDPPLKPPFSRNSSLEPSPPSSAKLLFPSENFPPGRPLNP